MYEFIPAQVQSYLDNNDNITLAYIARVETPASTETVPAYFYWTTAGGSVTIDSTTYTPNVLLEVGSYQQTAELRSYSINMTLSALDLFKLADIFPENPEVKTFVNKSVKLDLVLFDHSGSILGVIPHFTGSIEKVSGKASIKGGASNIQFQVSSHWKDFTAITSRFMTDAAHRGIGADGTPDGSAYRSEYETDLGFSNVGKALSIVSKYTTTEKRVRWKQKKNWLGIVTGGREKVYWEQVTRSVDLNFDIEAKYLPTVYGVRRLPGHPIFADVLENDKTKLYVVYAVCEGEIGGYLNLYIDGQPLICPGTYLNEDDKYFCVGNQKLGHTITTTGAVDDPITVGLYGTSHGGGIKVDIDDNGKAVKRFWFYNGTSNQVASSIMTDLVFDNYQWTSEHKLLDTAYVVMEVTMDDEQNELPEVEFVVQGRKVKVFSDINTYTLTSLTNNPVWFIYDFMTNDRFGLGLNPSDIDLQSFIDVAAVCDTLDTSYAANYQDYWRYVGWLSNADANRKLYQANVELNGAVTGDKALKGLLDTFDGSINMLGGKYLMTIKYKGTAELSIDVERDVIGAISLSDVSDSKKWNSFNTALPDPGAEGWSLSNIYLYNKTYLDADKGIKKQGSLNLPFVTNYYTARRIASQRLTESRFSRTFSGRLPYRFWNLYPNLIVNITSSSVGWVNKPFRVVDVTRSPKGFLDVTFKEYSDAVYEIDTSVVDTQEISTGTDTVVTPATNLLFTPYVGTTEELLNGYLTWTKSDYPSISHYELVYEGTTDPIIIPAALNQAAIYGLASGTYNFRLRTVASNGTKSREAKLTYSVGDPNVMPDVSNLVVVNYDPTVVSGFIGDYVELSWSDLSDRPGFQSYEVVVYDAADQVNPIRTVFPTSNTYIYTFANNKADYLSRYTTVGAFRSLFFKVRAISTTGGTSANWSTI